MGRISMTTPQTTAYYSTDTLGSVSELSGSGGSLLGQYDTQPFGDNPTASNVDPSVTGNPFGYTGEYQDPVTGLYNLRARQYDPTIARFLSADPLGPQDAASVYAYVADDPLRYTDASGMKRTPSCGLLCTVGAVVTANPLKLAASAGCYMTANAIAAFGLWKAGLISAEGETPTDFFGTLAHPGDVLLGASGPGLVAGGTYYLCGKISRQIANQVVGQKP